MNSTTLVIIVAVVALALVALAFLLRRGKKPADTGAAPEHDSVMDEAASAIEDVLGAFLKVDVHPGGPDKLTTIKGLGPKAAAQLESIGITRFAQLALMGDAEVAAVDAKMGPFQGRILRDQWVEQARLLSANDIAGFEATYGKLGG